MSSRMSRDLYVFGSRKAHVCSFFLSWSRSSDPHGADPRTAATDAASRAGVSGATNDRAGGGGRRRIHEKDFRRVDKFSGGEDEWKAWVFDFKVSARAADANLVEAMELVEIESKDISAADFSELEDEKWDKWQLYDILCMLTSCEAKSVIREVSGGDGIAAWQVFAKSYARRTLARVLRRYREVMNPVPAKELSEVVGVTARRRRSGKNWKELKGSGCPPW